MRSYAERAVFAPAQIDALREATDLVARVGDDWGDELRCHELARAACHCLRAGGIECAVRDGALYAIEHSWIELSGDPRFDLAILDVYAPGRLPQVQLIHGHFVVSRGYEIGDPRLDVDLDVVGRLVDEMSPRRGQSTEGVNS